MHTKRGCFSGVYHEGYVFVFGGLNYTDKILKKCERYSLQDNIWTTLSDMHEHRKNSSACSLTTDTIYVFGGTNREQASDTIEQYSLATN
jgi:N-acetylneuraminic acid mutarotase